MFLMSTLSIIDYLIVFLEMHFNTDNNTPQNIFSSSIFLRIASVILHDDLYNCRRSE